MYELQGGAGMERTFPDSGDGIGYVDALERLAAVESGVLDGGDRIGDEDVLLAGETGDQFPRGGDQQVVHQREMGCSTDDL